MDQESETTNAGAAVANTGGNVAVGNSSDNSSDTDQQATAFGGGGDTVAVNTASGGNTSNGSASIHTGNAHATGNQSTTSNTQVADTHHGGHHGGHHGSHHGGIVIADQEANTTNAGIGIANTGLNFAVGNSSTNESDTTQDAVAFGGDDDAVAVNIGGGWNHSTGSAHISTGDAHAVGNMSSTTNHQLIDTGDSHLVVADQVVDTDNVGFALANSGVNFAFANLSDTAADVDQDAVAFGGDDDAVAVNEGGAVNSSTGAAAIHTGNAHAVGNAAHNANWQGLHVAATRAGSNAIPLALLAGLLALGAPMRRLVTRRR